MSAATQTRIMGGAITLAIATSVFNTYTQPKLHAYVSSAHPSLESVYSVQGLATFAPAEQLAIRGILAKGYNLQMYVLCAFGAAQIPAALLLWRKKQIRV
jgi:hypothetical protein